jgi:uncharacterized phiE125 gp8 family phage protein
LPHLDFIIEGASAPFSFEVDMRSILLKPPLVSPISLVEMKAWLKINYSEEDDIINSLIASATTYVETKTRLALITRTYQCEGIINPRRPIISLPVAPVLNMSSVSLSVGSEIIAPDQYSFGMDGSIYNPILRFDLQQHSYLTANINFSLTLSAGFGDDATLIPEPLRLAIKRLSAFHYSQRGDQQEINMQEMTIITSLLAPYQRLKL